MSGDVVRMDIAEFCRVGFLQEANRRFFHPHGLALEVVTTADGTLMLGGVCDYRGDLEGVVFGEVDRAKVDRVAAEHERHREARLKMMGDVVQPAHYMPAVAKGDDHG